MNLRYPQGSPGQGIQGVDLGLALFLGKLPYNGFLYPFQAILRARDFLAHRASLKRESEGKNKSVVPDYG